jgi:hypothetical protein
VLVNITMAAFLKIDLKRFFLTFLFFFGIVRIEGYSFTPHIGLRYSFEDTKRHVDKRCAAFLCAIQEAKHKNFFLTGCAG